MTLVALEQFSGIAPAIHPKKLAESLAVISENTRLDRGVVEPWKRLGYVANAAYDTVSVYPYQGNYLLSNYRRQYVGAVRPNDPHDRIYYTDADYPKVRSGSQSFRLGLPKPPAPSSSIVTEGDKDNITDVIQTRYVVTIVDAWGSEGPPSDPTPPLEVGKDFEIEVTLSNSTVTGNYNLGTGSLFRLYRTNQGSDAEGIYQYVGQTNYGAASITDTVAAGDLQEELITQEWAPAPDDDTALYPEGPLASLIEVPGMGLCGHTGNTVFFSEPGVPTAWPYYYASQKQVLGVAVVQAGVLVMTESTPYLLTGSHPSALAQVSVETDQSCVSAASIVDFGEHVIYASPDGLVLVQGNAATLATEQLVDKGSWADFEPATIHGYQYEGKYIGFYGDGTHGFIFDPQGGENALTTLEGLGVEIVGGYHNAAEDRLELVYEEGTDRYIGSFNEGTAASFTRRTKPYLFPDPVSLTCVRVQADEYPVTLSAWTDGVARGPWTFTDDRPVKLPGGYRAREYQWEISGSGSVSGLYFTDSMAEMV